MPKYNKPIMPKFCQRLLVNKNINHTKPAQNAIRAFVTKQNMRKKKQVVIVKLR